MKKISFRPISFPKDIPVVSFVCSIILTVSICTLTDQELILFGTVITALLCWLGNSFWGKLNDFLEQSQDKVIEFFRKEDGLSLFYFLSILAAIGGLFDLRNADSFTIGWMIGIFFPILVRLYYLAKEMFKAGVRDIDLPQ